MAPESQSSSAATIAAARWMARRKAGLNAADRAELQAWLRADPRHAAALAQADPGASELDWPLHAGAIDRVLAGLEARSAKRRARRLTLVRTSVVAAMVLAGVLFTARWRAAGDGAGSSLVVRSPEFRTLPDGSVAELKDNAELRIDFNAGVRRVELVRGAAHFTVRENAQRPFVVSAGTVTARAVGTAFLVGLEGGQIALVVTEGRVALDRATPAVGSETLALVQAGESIAIDQNDGAIARAPRVTPLSAAEANARLAWRTPRLEFNGTPLQEIVAIVNRHNRDQLILVDPALGSLKLSGALHADRIDALVEMLETDFRVVVERSGNDLLLRQPAP